jgi:hypothetical protein
MPRPYSAPAQTSRVEAPEVTGRSTQVDLGDGQWNGAAAVSRSAGRTTTTAMTANASRIKTRTSWRSSSNQCLGWSTRGWDRVPMDAVGSLRAGLSLVGVARSLVTRAGGTAGHRRRTLTRGGARRARPALTSDNVAPPGRARLARASIPVLAPDPQVRFVLSARAISPDSS